VALYPINLKMNGRECLVLGGGDVAERKTHALLAVGAKVTILSPHLTPELKKLADNGWVIHLDSVYRPGAIEKSFIVICATDDASVNQQAAAEARGKGALVNVVDAPALCDFTVPAYISQGELLITVSTNGKSPALARRLREELEKCYGPEYGQYLDIVSRLREELKKHPGTAKERQTFWRENIDLEALALLRAGRIIEAEEKIRNAANSIRT
jgi:precorrin-2 dehydrogenase/sirohydrochlorin ferrochelatase